MRKQSDKPSRLHPSIAYFKVLNPKRSAARIALTYLIFGGLWILTTDKILEFFFGTSQTYNLFQTFKGWVYVALTAFVAYTLVISTLELYQQARNKVQESKEELEEQFQKTLESERRFDLAVKGSFDSIWEYDGIHEHYFMSNAILKGLGYEPNKIILNTLEDFVAYIAPVDKHRFLNYVQSFSDIPTELFELTYRLVRPDGSIAWIRTRGSAQISPSGKIMKVAGSHTDISVLIDHQEELTKIAYYDHLTGLPNWKGFSKIVTQRILERPQDSFSILYFDLDDFQNINDFHGYPFGDKLLMEIASVFKQTLKPDDQFASLGGDSYGFLLESTDHLALLRRITDLYDSLKTIESIEGRVIDISACIGIAQYPKHGKDYDELLHSADEAMHAAKNKGKNTHVFFTESLHEEQLNKIAMTNQLRKAVTKNELTMMYQPIYRLSDGTLASMEALIRWHPFGKTAVSPDIFIPMAETSGLIRNIELWVFEAVFKQVLAYRSIRARSIPIAINLSSKGISDEDFIKSVIVMMNQYGILAEEIEIEITETSLIEHTDLVLANLHLLHQQGIKILLDDFGKGYSSLTYLVSLPIDAIKIDKGFTQKIHSSKDIDAVIQAIVDLAHSINLKVVAEGIELDNQKEFLKSLGVDYGQGYLLRHPTYPDDLVSELK